MAAGLFSSTNEKYKVSDILGSVASFLVLDIYPCRGPVSSFRLQVLTLESW